MRHLYLVLSVSFIFLFCFGSIFAEKADRDWKKIYNEAKEEFVKKFDKFKKEGLSIEKAKDLFEKLLDAGGKNIEGTGTKTLLKTLHKQAGNIVWLKEKKETLEDLIDFVGDIYAMSISDTPPKGVDAYKALVKGVALSSKLANKIPVLNKFAVPMINMYVKALKNGEKHIVAISAATDAKNRAIKLGWMSIPYDDLLLITDMEGEEEEPLSKEELEWEEIRKEERVRHEACAKQCEAKYLAYEKASLARYHAIKNARISEKTLEEAVKVSNTKCRHYNNTLKRYKKYRQGFKEALDNYRKEKARMIRARQEGNTQGEQARKKMLIPYKKKLDNWKETLRKDFYIVVEVQKKYFQAKVNASTAKEKYETLLRNCKKINVRFQKMYKVYNKCIKNCLEFVDSRIEPAFPIPGLFNTGVDNSGVVLPFGKVDMHYKLVGPLSPAIIITNHPYWISAPAGSRWIAPTNHTTTDPAGQYSYFLNFSLEGLDHTTAIISGSWGSDDSVQLILNGVNTKNTSNSFGALAGFTVKSGFKPGANTFEFRTTNSPQESGNPTGLVVTKFNGTAKRLGAE